MNHEAGSKQIPLTPFDVFRLRTKLAEPGPVDPEERLPLSMALLGRGLGDAGLLWSRPTERTIVTFWDETPIGPVPVLVAGPDAGPDAAPETHSPHPLLWGCSRDTLVCRADRELVTFVDKPRRSIRMAVDDWNATEAWPAGAITFGETLRATIRVPLYAGSTMLELSMLCVQMSRAVGNFYSEVTGEPGPR